MSPASVLAFVDPDQKSQIQAWVKKHPRQLKTVLEKIKAEWGITMSVKTVKRVLAIAQSNPIAL